MVDHKIRWLECASIRIWTAWRHNWSHVFYAAAGWPGADIKGEQKHRELRSQLKSIQILTYFEFWLMFCGSGCCRSAWPNKPSIALSPNRWDRSSLWRTWRTCWEKSSAERSSGCFACVAPKALRVENSAGETLRGDGSTMEYLAVVTCCNML